MVLNWNGWPDTIACLDSLVLQDYPYLHALVVDNGSTNDSVARIQAAHPGIEIVQTGRNLGYAGGCNAGFRRALELGAGFIWALNNDTVCPPDTCSKLVRKASLAPEAGLIGSVLYYMHDASQVQAWGGGSINIALARSRHFHSAEDLAMAEPPLYLTFASVLIRREVMESVGLLWEGFFMYYDDTDYCLRASRAGFGMTVAEDTAILHKEGGSTARRSPVVDRYSFAAGLHFLKRYASNPLPCMAFFLVTKAIKRLLHGEWPNAWATVQAVGDYRRQRKDQR